MPCPSIVWARLSRERGAFRRALDNDSLDAAWRSFEKLALKYHSERVGETQHRSPGRLRWGVAEAAAKYVEDPWLLASRAAQAALRRAYNVRSQARVHGAAHEFVSQAVAGLERSLGAEDPLRRRVALGYEAGRWD